jgi:hypothetical protein
MKISTTCEQILWAGFFGNNPNGDQPECGTYIELDVEEDYIDKEEPGIRPSYSIRCPKCNALLEWPQEWEEVKEESA